MLIVCRKGCKLLSSRGTHTGLLGDIRAIVRRYVATNILFLFGCIGWHLRFLSMYIKHVVSVRRVLAGLRAGCLPLQIELGRYTSPKTPLNMRICKLCNEGTEDQEHFLFHCRALTKPRNDFFCRVQTLNPDFLSYTLLNKRQYLLCPQQHIHCIAHGIYCMYTFRQNLLYSFL